MLDENKIFKALSDETRLRVLNLFVKSGENLCVRELMDALKIPQYKISKALNVLKKAGLVEFKKESTFIYYMLNSKIQKNKDLFKFLNSYLSNELFKEDEHRLEKRLSLRVNNKCVVGIIPEKELLKLLK